MKLQLDQEPPIIFDPIPYDDGQYYILGTPMMGEVIDDDEPESEIESHKQ